VLPGCGPYPVTCALILIAIAFPLTIQQSLTPPHSRGSRVPSILVKSLLGCAGMSDRHLTHIRQLTALCLLLCAVVMIGLAIAGALKGTRSPVPGLASQK
jgi:hypothetical protein